MQVTDVSYDREFFVSFSNLPITYPLRELTADRVGQLISFTATVVRTSEVKPELFYGGFECMDCGSVYKNIEQHFKYTEPTICSNVNCTNKKNWKVKI